MMIEGATRDMLPDYANLFRFPVLDAALAPPLAA